MLWGVYLILIPPPLLPKLQHITAIVGRLLSRHGMTALQSPCNFFVVVGRNLGGNC